MKRLNIFVDETGEFGFEKGSSELYGVSFVLHEQKDDITFELNILNERLKRLGYNGMIHTASLIMGRSEYNNYDIKLRKSIFNSIYQFSKKIKVKYKSIFINKRYIDNSKSLRLQILTKINKMIKENEKFFNKFDKVIIYYDNGQESLGKILEYTFCKFKGFSHIIDFNHEEKRLFQVCDMLTYIDKYDYKYKNKMSFTKSEKFFFSVEEIRKILKELNKKRL